MRKTLFTNPAFAWILAMRDARILTVGLTLASSFIISSTLIAQTYCGSSRYDTEMFSSITTTSDVVYGQNLDVNNNMKVLKMDIYQPAGDVATQRPFIILAHGGSFIGGSKTDSYLVTLCTRFAKRGYVVASIEYRLGMGLPSKNNAQKAVWRATQDMKAVVRFFRKDAATTNTYKVDPNFAFVGGYSAGAFMGVQYAYLDQPSEIPAAIDTNALGGFEGNSGNPGYSTAINGVLNIAGAVGDTAWMHPGDEPMVTTQGDVDGTVPYCTAMISISGFPIMVVSGGGTMHIRCFNTGIYNPIHTYYGQDHPASVSPAINMDSSVVHVSNFIYKMLGCTPVGDPATHINNQTCVQNATGIHNANFNDDLVSLYPNPAQESVLLTLAGTNGTNFSGEIRDLTGRRVQQFEFSGNEFTVERKNLPDGVYFLKLESNSGELYTAKIIFTE